jgi:hypothetical protein
MLPLRVQFIIAMVVYVFNERAARRLDYLIEEVRVQSAHDPGLVPTTRCRQVRQLRPAQGSGPATQA